MTFRVGQKVVCVDARPELGGEPHWHVEVEPLVQGRVYIVDRGNFKAFTGSDVIQLIEAKNPFGYLARRFRPIVERKTDISIFTKMLTPEGVDA